MARGIKIALPGYNALTDTDPNHFALYVDQEVDYILIKEKEKDSVSVTTDLTVSHGLDYVPLCFVFGEVSSGVWRKLFSHPLDTGGLWFEVDDTDLILHNTTGSPKNFSYNIFYDDITSVAQPLDPQPLHMGFVVGKIGVNAEEATDPNDFIFHSDYNTFKIIEEATVQLTLAASTNNQSFSVAHNQPFIPVASAFAKEVGVDQVFLPNSGNVDVWVASSGYEFTGILFNYFSTDATNITFNFDNPNGTPSLVDVRYFLLEKMV